MQIDLHVFGDEVRRVQRRLHCVLQISQCAREIRDAQRIRRRAQTFLAAKHVNCGLGKKLIDVKKVGPAEHVKRDRDRPQRFWKICFLPRVQFLKLTQIEFEKLSFKKCGVFLPCRIAHERRKRGILRYRHSCKKTRHIVGSGIRRHRARCNLWIFLRRNAEHDCDQRHDRR